ncbi:tail fiber domain-containing protein [Enterobacter roggenkampii]|uniref:tail fiber domain-containing protein n=1 Tax=Enterobacter roggenkampii TaxID=1812935 RepID=UPI003D7D5F0B
MLYNTGTIAINGNTATGTGTNWTAPASQVRAGQTIIVMSSPVQIFQISSVDSSTSMTVTPAAAPALSGQKYGILVSDNISVDGLAQAMSQLIKEYDENIGAWETFATTSANQNITVTINGASVTIPGIGKLAQKGTNGALPIDQGGTGATTAEGSRTNLGLGNSATKNVGTDAGTVAAGDDSRLTTVNGKTGGTVSGSVIATSGNQVGIASGSGGNKSISLSNVSSDGPTENYVNWIAGNYYAGIWRMGAIRGAGTDLNRVQMNIFDGISTNSDYRWYSDGRFRSKSVQAPGVGGGGGYMDIANADNTNISFCRPNLTQNNDSGYVPALRWHSGASGGYHAATAIGSVANGASAWPSIVMMTLGDGGNAGTRAWQFNLVSGDIYVSGTGGFAGDYVFNKSATSDANLKKDITYTDGKASVENIKAMKPTTFIYKNDEKERIRRGVIAQDIMLIDPDYVKEVPGGIEIEEDGTETQKPSTLALDNNVLLVDAVLALNYVIKKLEATQNELEELKLKIAAS